MRCDTRCQSQMRLVLHLESCGSAEVKALAQAQHQSLLTPLCSLISFSFLGSSVLTPVHGGQSE